MVEQSKIAVSEDQKPSEAQIQEAELGLGLKTENDKLVEASLFIDKKFLSYALIMGVVKSRNWYSVIRHGLTTWMDGSMQNNTEIKI